MKGGPKGSLFLWFIMLCFKNSTLQSPSLELGKARPGFAWADYIGTRPYISPPLSPRLAALLQKFFVERAFPDFMICG